MEQASVQYVGDPILLFVLGKLLVGGELEVAPGPLQGDRGREARRGGLAAASSKPRRTEEPLRVRERLCSPWSRSSVWTRIEVVRRSLTWSQPIKPRFLWILLVGRITQHRADLGERHRGVTALAKPSWRPSLSLRCAQPRPAREGGVISRKIRDTAQQAHASLEQEESAADGALKRV